MVVVVMVIIAMGLLCLGNIVLAADRGGGRSGGYHEGGGRYGGHGRGDYGDHYGGYYRGGWGHSGSRFDVVIGSPFWDPWYYSYYPYYPYYSYYPYYYPFYSPPVVDEPATPGEYIQRSKDRPSSSEQDRVWYYCPESKAYYPYVKKCPGGWQTVPAEPPSEEER